MFSVLQLPGARRLMIRLLSALFKVALRARVEGRDKLPPRGSVIYVARHRRRIDGLLLALLLPGRPVLVVDPADRGGRLHRWVLGWVAHRVLDLSEPASMRPLLRLLSQEKTVVLFPTGAARETRCLLRVYDVPALAAARSGAQVVAVDLRYGGKYLPRVRIEVVVAERLRLPTGGGQGSRRLRANEGLRRLLESSVLGAARPATLMAAFLQAMREQGGRRKILEDSDARQVSYRELLRGGLAIGRWVAGQSRPGEFIGVMLPNAIPTACTILGIGAFGRVPAMLNYSAGAGPVSASCVAAGVRLVVTSRHFVARAGLDAVVCALAGRQIVYLEDLRARMGVAGRLWVLCATLWPERIVASGKGSDPAAVLFTSGSEARPKAVVLSHDGVLANIDQLGLQMDFDERDKVLNPLPLYHSYSFTAGLLLCLLTGTRLLLYLSPLHYRAIPELAYRAECTYLFGTSTFLSYYGRFADPLDFRSLRFVISGGEKLGEDVARLWRDRFGLRIHEGYGATECSPVIAVSATPTYRPGTVGRLLPAMEYRIRPVTGISRGGVLHLRGPNLMLGYCHFERPGEIQAPTSEVGPGWYDTGDVVEMGDDGLLSVVGRVRRFAKIAGEMVSLDLLEEVAQVASPEFRHAALLRADAERGETTMVFTTDPTLDRPRLARAAQELGYRDLAVARSVQWRPELPVLASGKTDYLRLAEPSQEAPVRMLAPSSPVGNAVDRTRQIVG